MPHVALAKAQACQRLNVHARSITDFTGFETKYPRTYVRRDLT